MAKRDSHWELNIQTGIEVQQASFNKAAKIFDNFYNKYNDQKIQVDTSDLIQTVRDGVSEIKKLYNEGTLDNVGWLNTRPELKASFEAVLNDAEEMFNGIKVLFNDGSYVSGFEDILRGFNNQLSIVFSDIGGLYDELNSKQKSLVDNLGGIALRSYFDQSDVRDRIGALQELIDVQNEMVSINPNLNAKDFASGYNSERLEEFVRAHRRALEDMLDFELDTMDQVARRRQLLEDINYMPYDDDSQYYAKEDKNYKDSIASLKEYIKNKQELIDTLENSEDELFRTSGIDGYKAQLRGQINTLEGYKKELEDLLGDSSDGPVNPEIINQLKEIKGVIQQLADAFKPLTDAFSREDSALSAMVKANVADLEILNAKVEETFRNIEDLSKKDFNITNITQTNSTEGVSNALRKYKQTARELSKQVASLYSDALTTGDILGSAGSNKFLTLLQNLATGDGTSKNSKMRYEGFALDDLNKSINKAKGLDDIDSIIDQLNYFKKLLIEFNELRNTINPGSYVNNLKDIQKQSDSLQENVDKAKEAANANERLAESQKNKDIDIKTEPMFEEIKTLSEQVQAEFTSIRAKMETTFDFSTLDPKIDSVKNITDAIYKQFEELQAKIKALDLNLEIPAVIAKTQDDGKEKSIIDNSATTSANEISTEAGAMQDVKTGAENAAKAKEKFADANKKVAKTAQDTSDEVAKETKKMEEAAGAIVEASDKFDKVKYVVGPEGDPYSKTTTSTTTRQNAIETESSYYTYEDDEYQLQATTIVKDFKKRAAELKKESDKIALAQKTVDKFLSQFESKTAGQASTIKGFDGKDGLKNFKISSLDDIEKATQKMIDLDNEYNKITKNFRQGTKSMNPFVNAITGVNEMENKIREAEIAFNALNTKPDELSAEISSLNPLFKTMMSFISTDANDNKAITDIYGMSEAYGKLNSALRQVNSNIKIQKQIDSAKSKDTAFGLDLEKQLSGIIKQQAQWEKNGQVTDEVRQKIENMFDSLSKVTNSSELSAWKAQWSIVKNEVATTKAEVDTVNKAQREETNNLHNAIALQDKLYNAKKQLARVDAGSAKGIEQTRKVKEAQEQYDVALLLLKNAEDYVSVQERQVQLEKELAAVRMQSQNSYGKTIYNRETRHNDTINANLRNIGVENLSEDFLGKVKEYENAYQRLKLLREEIVKNPLASNSVLMQNSFQDATLEAEKLRKEVLEILKGIQKFDSIPQGSLLGTQTFDKEQLQDLKSTMIDFAAEVTDGQFKLEGFNTAGTEMYGTLDKGAGVVEKVTVALREGTNQLYAYQTGTKDVSSSWQKLGSELSGGIKKLAVMYLSFHDIIRYVRQGLKYVKEIDLALTELKKVTDETDATYRKFLGTASDISSVIGSTISDFTDATAAFARLGYSITESTEMAKTAIVYKNVAD